MHDSPFTAPVAPFADDSAARPLKGLYLEAELPDHGRAGPWVYANFVTTLDGRISTLNCATGRESVPDTIGDPRDWRLYQELACRADVLISSGRYLRDLEAGTAQDILPLGSSAAFADLHQWRRDQGMPPQPDLAIVSASLDFGLPPILLEQGRRIIVVTTMTASVERAQRLTMSGARVIRVSGDERVSGRAAVDQLAALGYKRVYSVAGSQVLQTLAQDDVLETLFLTLRYRLLGGPGSSIFTGPALNPPMDLEMRWMYRDMAPQSAGQCFIRFDRI